MEQDDFRESLLNSTLECGFVFPDIIKCKHGGCRIEFKTNKQKTHHHVKNEKECIHEIKILLKLIKVYKNVYNSLLIKYRKFEKINTNKKYIELRNYFDHVKESMNIKEYFNAYVGKNFEMF